MNAIEAEIDEYERLAAESAEPAAKVAQRNAAFASLYDDFDGKYVAYREHWDAESAVYELEIVASDESYRPLLNRLKAMNLSTLEDITLFFVSSESFSLFA